MTLLAAHLSWYPSVPKLSRKHDQHVLAAVLRASVRAFLLNLYWVLYILKSTKTLGILVSNFPYSPNNGKNTDAGKLLELIFTYMSGIVCHSRWQSSNK
jgi:hypothetical protein